MRLGAFEVHEPVPELEVPHALAILQSWKHSREQTTRCYNERGKMLSGHADWC
ncbi:MAG: hypothetical protein MUO92_01795 [Dehalococcoidales bacterium]|nr:hypothetical protein [Dehalococcoidales bacterium]